MNTSNFIQELQELCDKYSIILPENTRLSYKENYVQGTLKYDSKEVNVIPNGGTDSKGPFLLTSYEEKEDPNEKPPLELGVNIGDSIRLYPNKSVDPGFREVINNVRDAHAHSEIAGF